MVGKFDLQLIITITFLAKNIGLNNLYLRIQFHMIVTRITLKKNIMC